MMNVHRLRDRLLEIYDWLDKCSGGTLEIFQTAIHRFSRTRAAEAAASMSFFAIFSIFPLLLVMSSIVGFVLVSAEAPEKILTFIAQAFPLASRLLEDNIVQILSRRSVGGFLGLTALIWSASGVFTTLVRNINRAWPGASHHSYIQGRLIGIGFVAIIIILILLLLLSNTLFSLLPRLNIPIQGSISVYDTFFWNLLSTLVPWFFTFLFFFAVYLWLPNTKVCKQEAFWGAILATIGFEVTSGVYSWYLSSGLARYELIYGSLGALVGALTWVYLSALIILFGAHFSSAIASVRRLNQK